jgi:hypothetical protein
MATTEIIPGRPVNTVAGNSPSTPSTVLVEAQHRPPGQLIRLLGPGNKIVTPEKNLVFQSMPERNFLAGT